MKLPIIDGRECLPVRLLPYLTSWCPVTPDVVAKLFSQRDAWRTWTATTFNLDGDSKHHKLLPREWDHFDDELTILASDLKLQEAFDLQKYPEWRRRSVEILPAAVFVWRDEFEADFARTFAQYSYPSLRPGAREISEEESEAELEELIRLGNDPGPSAEEGLREIEQIVERDMFYRDGDGELCFDPLLSDEERRLVFEGFEPFLTIDPSRGTVVKRIPAHRAQEESILAQLASMNLDPLRLPRPPAGKQCPIKKSVQEALQYSDEVMRKAWQRLRSAGSIVNA